jgi:hypothetical protein
MRRGGLRLVLSQPGPDNARGPKRRIGIQGSVQLKCPGQLLQESVHTGKRCGTEAPVVVKDVNATPIGQRWDRELGEGLEKRF